MKYLKTQPKSLAVADFGCGDAELARKVKQKVHSFDLESDAPGVIACNMANVPLPDDSVHVAVFHCRSWAPTTASSWRKRIG